MFALTRAIAGSTRIAVVGKPFVVVKAVDAIAFNSARTLATAATPKKKTAAASATATKKTAPASKTSATKKTTTTAAKGKATTAAASKKAPAKKTATGTKKTPAQKATAAPKKAVRVKKVQTPEEKAEIKLKENFKELKLRALEPPKSRTSGSSWLVFVKEKLAQSPKGTQLDKIAKDIAAEWRQLSPEQRQAYENNAEFAAAKEALQKDLTAWVNKHTPNQIYQANLARAQLRKLRVSENPPRGIKTSSWRPIPDARQPLGPRTGPVLYAMERFKDLTGTEKVEKLGSIMRDYKALPEADKKRYTDMAAKDYERYDHEMKTLGIERQHRRSKKEEAA